MISREHNKEGKAGKRIAGEVSVGPYKRGEGELNFKKKFGFRKGSFANVLIRRPSAPFTQAR